MEFGEVRVLDVALFTLHWMAWVARARPIADDTTTDACVLC